MNDTYSRREGNVISLGTDKLAMELTLTPEGRFVQTSLCHRVTGKEYVQCGPVQPDEFSIEVNGERICGNRGGFTLTGVETRTLSQGEEETIVSLRRAGLAIRRHYIAYPGLAIVQSFTEYVNESGADMTVSKPSLFVVRLLGGEQAKVDFTYMTGGANFTGSQVMKTVPVTDGFVKHFDSQGAPEMMEVDGKYGNTWHDRLNGCGVWNEFFAMRPAKGDEGFFLTFDYQGWWKACASCCDHDLALVGRCELLNDTLPAGETLRIAPMTFGFYCGDFDDLGNTITDYIYQYKWDYTRDAYFNRTSLSIWRAAPLTDKVFQMIEAARYIGYERLWVDDFWFDAKGNWNGIFGDDWREINAYLRRQGMLFRLWMPPWHADRLSKVWVEHPEWMLDFHGNWYNWTIDMSQEDAYQWVLNMLCEKQKEFGTYDLRVDGDPCNLKNNRSFMTQGEGGWNCTLKQSEQFYRLYREFKERNPEAGLDGCSSGGHTLGIESGRYTDQQQITDGMCMHMGGYYTTMLLPIDKHQGMPIARKGEGMDWQHHTDGDLNLFSAPLHGMQDPEDGVAPEALEGYRKDLELFYFLRRQGVYGRYIKVFRPTMEHGDKTFLLQRMTRDLEKGLLMISSNQLNPLLGKTDRVFLKGLDPEKDYLIESRLGSVPTQTRTGMEWMRDGVLLTNVQPGEVLFLNLPDRPGTGSIKEQPAAPTQVQMAAETWLRRQGIGVSWQPSANAEIVSYYEIARDGAPLTKVSIGTYFFDTDAQGNHRYAVRAVDYDGKASAWVEA